MASLLQILDALADQIADELCGTVNPLIPELQVDGRLVPTPSPPSIDIYPDELFMEPQAMHEKWIRLIVRARVGTADNEGGQDLLLSMMDNEATTSVEAAILSDKTLNGTVGKVHILEGPSGFARFQDPGPTPRDLMGCVWTLRVFR